jgi:hypothetical protein
VILTFSSKGGSVMADEQKGGEQNSWFLIMVSWEPGGDGEAVKRFHQVYMYLNIRAPFNTDDDEKKSAIQQGRKEEYEQYLKDNELALETLDENDPVYDIVEDSIKALNLIGRRKFVIIFQTKSNRVLQRLSKIISLGTEISVEIFPATYVTELKELLHP